MDCAPLFWKIYPDIYFLSKSIAAVAVIYKKEELP